MPAGSSNKYQAWEVVDPEKWVPDGYAVVRVDSRGAGRSPGVIDIWSRREAMDLAQGVEWAGIQPWSNGKVGLNGISLTARLGATFPYPVSRHAEIDVHDVPWRRGLTCLAQSPKSGFCLVADAPRNAHYMFNHLEYDADTLKIEYLRDCARRAGTAVPQNYLPNGDMSKAPSLAWRRPAEKLFANWLTDSRGAPAHPTGSGPKPVRGMTVVKGTNPAMDVSIMVLLGFAAWTLLTLFGGIGVYRWSFAS